MLVGENDHYKPLAVTLRQLLAEAPSARWCSRTSRPSRKRLKTADDWRNDESMAGGDAFFEEGIHWLHLAGSLGPTITSIHGFRPAPSRDGPDRRAKSMLVAFTYDNGAVGSLYYSREIPSLLKGLRLSKLYGPRRASSPSSRTARSCSCAARACRGSSFPASATSAATRRCIVISRASIERGTQPEMSLERAMEDQR